MNFPNYMCCEGRPVSPPDMPAYLLKSLWYSRKVTWWKISPEGELQMLLPSLIMRCAAIVLALLLVFPIWIDSKFVSRLHYEPNLSRDQLFTMRKGHYFSQRELIVQKRRNWSPAPKQASGFNSIPNSVVISVLIPYLSCQEWMRALACASRRWNFLGGTTYPELQGDPSLYLFSCRQQEIFKQKWIPAFRQAGVAWPKTIYDGTYLYPTNDLSNDMDLFIPERTIPIDLQNESAVHIVSPTNQSYFIFKCRSTSNGQTESGHFHLGVARFADSPERIRRVVRCFFWGRDGVSPFHFKGWRECADISEIRTIETRIRDFLVSFLQGTALPMQVMQDGPLVRLTWEK